MINCLSLNPDLQTLHVLYDQKINARYSYFSDILLAKPVYFRPVEWKQNKVSFSKMN